MMIQAAHKLITTLEQKIQNGAKVRLTADGKKLIVRVDWWDIDHHAEHKFGDGDGWSLNEFAEYCRRAYIIAQEAREINDNL